MATTPGYGVDTRGDRCARLILVNPVTGVVQETKDVSTGPALFSHMNPEIADRIYLNIVGLIICSCVYTPRI